MMVLFRLSSFQARTVSVAFATRTRGTASSVTAAAASAALSKTLLQPFDGNSCGSRTTTAPSTITTNRHHHRIYDCCYRSYTTKTNILLLPGTNNNNELPYHLVVGLPALSPTMETGTLAEWYIKAGDVFSAGDAIAKIDTDKASMDFEAQDDGYVAKLLVGDGEGNDLPVGTPIMITVEEENDVEAFKDYVHSDGASSETSEPVIAEPAAPPPTPTPAAAVSPPPPIVASPTPSSPTTPIAAAAAAVVPSPAVAVVEPSPTSSASVIASWGLSVINTSPISKSLGKQQMKYIELYGNTGQRPIV